MHRLIAISFVGFVLALFSGTSWAELYRWVDENGVVHVTDTPPPDQKNNLEILNQEKRDLPPPNNNPEKNKRKKIKNTNPYREKTVKEAKPKVIKYHGRVELYTTSWCGYCEKARQYFRSKGIRYSEYDIEKNTSALRRRKALYPGQGVPLAIINGKKILGFSPADYESAMK